VGIIAPGACVYGSSNRRTRTHRRTADVVAVFGVETERKQTDTRARDDDRRRRRRRVRTYLPFLAATGGNVVEETGARPIYVYVCICTHALRRYAP